LNILSFLLIYPVASFQDVSAIQCLPAKSPTTKPSKRQNPEQRLAAKMAAKMHAHREAVSNCVA
jgi:hypothetical protein